MRTKQLPTNTFSLIWGNRRGQRRWLYFKVMAGAIFLCFLTVGSIWYGVRLDVSGQAQAYFERWQHVKQASRQPKQTLINYWQGWWANPEKLAMDFKFSDWEQLAAKQQAAVLSGSLFEQDNPWVKGWINYRGNKIRIKAKLKGAREHWNSDKWSFRIDVVDQDDAILGLQSFSLQHPRTRFYLSEWIFHRLLSREGIIALNYQFVDVTVNGRHEGIYALEEHFTTQLVERNHRRDGPLVVISEDLYNFNYWPQAVWRNETRRIEPYQKEKYADDPLAQEQLVAARTLIEGFRRGELNTCAVFSCDLLARYFAILDVLGAEHAASGGNFKMYYNPLLARLEPVGFDAEPVYGTHALFINDWQNYKNAGDSVNWFRSIFSDEQFLTLFMQELDRLTQPGYLESFFAEIDRDARAALSIMHRDFPDYNYDWNAVLEQRGVIRKILSANHLVDAYIIDRRGTTLTIEASNIMSVPVIITDLIVNGETISLTQPVQLDALAPDKLPVFQPLKVTLPPHLSNPDSPLQVQYNLLGLTDKKTDDVSPWRRLFNDFIEQQALFLPANFREFPFAQVDDLNKRIIIKKGRWELTKTITIPAPYVLFLEAGAILDLRHGASLISYGPVQLQGQPDEPVQIITGDGSGGGIAILQASDTSYWRYAHIEGLRPPELRGWRPSGAITFYESPIDLTAVEIRKNVGGDDLLNIVRSPFNLRETVLSNALGDALDGDFSHGEITQTTIERANNDAFDFSGSNVVLKEVTVRQAGDKGVSVGENSNIQIYDSIISQSVIGLASKDNSQLTIARSRLIDLMVGVAVYQKKPEFGSAQAQLRGTLVDADRAYLIEENSFLSRDGVTENGQEKNVAQQTEELVAYHASQR